MGIVEPVRGGVDFIHPAAAVIAISTAPFRSSEQTFGRFRFLRAPPPQR